MPFPAVFCVVSATVIIAIITTDHGALAVDDFGTANSPIIHDEAVLTKEQRLLPTPVIRYGTQAEVRLSCAAFFRGYPLLWKKLTGNNETAEIIDETHRDVTRGALSVNNATDLVIRNPGRKRYPLTTGNYTCQLDRRKNTSQIMSEDDENYLKNVSNVVHTVTYATTPDIRIDSSASTNQTLIVACIYSGHSIPTPLGFYVHTRDPVTDIRKDRTLFMHDPVQNIGNSVDSLPDCAAPNKGKKCSKGFMFYRNVTLENGSVGGKDPQFEAALLMEIPTVNVTDAGHYGCWAGNDVGTSYAQMKLNVKVCPDGAVCFSTEPADPYF